MNTFDSLIGKAYKFAKKKHAGQLYGDKPFIYHPKQVAKIIKILSPNDAELIAAAYLHDILEDTKTSYIELLEEFGANITGLVHEVTKSEYNTFPALHTQRGILLKFADRTANLSNIKHWSEDRQQEYLQKSVFWKTV